MEAQIGCLSNALRDQIIQGLGKYTKEIIL
jgi:hypothetical protein